MSGTYGMGCCRCGTSCGGLNYPFRGRKDSFFEGGFRAIGILRAPLLRAPGSTYDGLFSLVDWWATLVDAALAFDDPATRLRALAVLRKRGLLPPPAGRGGGGAAGTASVRGTSSGPIDSLSHWHSIAMSVSSPTTTSLVNSPTHSIHGASPRSEILLSGFASDRSSAAIRVGELKLLVGRWGSPLWCDLNASGFSPVYPAR